MFWFTSITRTRKKSDHGAVPAFFRSARITGATFQSSTNSVWSSPAGCRLSPELSIGETGIQVLDDSTDENCGRGTWIVITTLQRIPRQLPTIGSNREASSGCAHRKVSRRRKARLSHLRRGFRTAEDFCSCNLPLHRSQDWHGANPLERTSIAIFFLTEVEAILLDGHFVPRTFGRARSNVFFNLTALREWCGGKAIGRRRCSTNFDRRHRPFLSGATQRLEVRYLQDVECPAELPGRNDCL